MARVRKGEIAAIFERANRGTMSEADERALQRAADEDPSSTVIARVPENE